MSDLAVIPFQPGTPEYDAYVHGSARGLGLTATNVLPGAIAQVLPSPNATGIEHVIPGAASGMYSTADYLQGLVQRLGGTAADKVWHLPGGEEAAKLSAGSQQLADDLIPHMHAQDEHEQAVVNIANTGGAMAVPLPGAIAARLPTAARVLGHVMLPGPKAVLPSIAAGGVLGEVNDALAKGDQPQAGSIDNPINIYDTGPGNKQSAGQPVGQSATSSPPVQPGQVAPTGPTVDGDGAINIFGTPQAPVTTSEQDPSSWSWKHTVLVGLGSVAVLAGGRMFRDRLGKIAEAKYPDASTDFNTQLAAGEPNIPAPLPPGTTSAVTRLANSVQDRTATARAYLRSTADTPVLGQQMDNKYGDITGQMASVARYQSGAERGELHGVSMPPLTKWQQDIAKLSPQQQTLLDLGMRHGNEIDNRSRVQQQFIQSTGAIPPDPQIRVDFAKTDTADLRATVALAEADPQIKDIMDRARQQSDAMADMMVKHGLVTTAEGQLFKARHRYYVPDADINSVVENPLKLRDITPGTGSDAVGRFWDLRDQHDYALYKAVDDNTARGMLLTNGLNYQGRDLPNAPGVKPAEVFTPSKDANGNWVAKKNGRSLPWRNNGVVEHYEVNNPEMLRAMQAPPVQTSTALSAVNKVRQFQQSFITGPGAIAAGHVFPVINALRSAGEISVLRQPGMYGSHIDKFVQRASGGRLSFRGEAITPYLGTAYRMATGAGAETTRALGSVFDPAASNGINTRMRALFGDNMVDAMHARMMAVYDNSTRAAMRERGLLNSAGMTARDVGDNNVRATGATALMPSADMVPELFRMNDMGGVAPTYIRLRNLFDEMRSVLGDAAHANFFELNRDNPNITGHQLNYEVRNITGDPSTHGAGGVARAFGQTVPFGNVAIQEVSRVARSMSRDPWGTLLGYTTHYGTLAAASAFTAMLAGPAAIKDLFDSTTDQERSNAARMYVPGHPDQPIKLPLQIMMRTPYNVMVQLFHDALNLPMHEYDPDIATRAMHIMTDLFSKHVWQSTIHGSIAGLSSGLPPLMPAGANAGAQLLTGHTVDPTLYNAYMNADKPIYQQFGYDVTGQGRGVPGQRDKVDPVTGSVNGNMWQHVVSDIMGVGGIAAWNAAREVHNSITHDTPLSGALHNIMQDYGMRVRDSFPGANLLWNQDDKLNLTTPLEQRVQATLDKMRPMMTWKGDIKYEGYTRKGGQLLNEPTPSNVPTDPTMQRLYAEVGAYANVLSDKPQSLMKQVGDIRKQMNSLDRSPMSPEAVRDAKNNYVRQLQDKYSEIMAVIHTMNGRLSDTVGAPVDVRTIDWRKGPDQFQRQ